MVSRCCRTLSHIVANIILKVKNRVRFPKQYSVKERKSVANLESQRALCRMPTSHLRMRGNHLPTAWAVVLRVVTARDAERNQTAAKPRDTTKQKTVGKT